MVIEDAAARVGKNIRDVRNGLRKSLGDISEKSGISTSQLSRYENGYKTPNIVTLAAIAKALGKSIDDLYFGPSSDRPISTAGSEEELVVNCFAALVNLGVVRLEPQFNRDGCSLPDPRLAFGKYQSVLQKLCTMLEDFAETSKDYDDPDAVKQNYIHAAVKQLARAKKEGF